MFLAVSLASCPGMSFVSVSVGRAKHFFAQYISVDVSSKFYCYGMFNTFSLEKEPQRYMRYWAVLKLGAGGGGGGGGGGGDSRVLGCRTATNSRGEDVGKGEGALRLGVPIISINLSAHSFSKRSNCLGSLSFLYRSDRDFTTFAAE